MPPTNQPPEGAETMTNNTTTTTTTAACTHEGGTDWVAIQMPHGSREGILEICQDCDAASKTHEVDCEYITSLSDSACDCDAEWTS